jgi:copper chaperone CopZ
MVGSVGKWLVIGLVIAALITALVPDDLFVSFAQYPILAMIAVVIIAVPMYVCATGSIPIALSLIMKGLTPGVAFVFLMAGPAVNFASYTLLSRTMGRRNTLIYIAIIALSAIGVGVIIDYLLPSEWFVPQFVSTAACCAHHTPWFNTACSVVLCALLMYVFIIKRIINREKRNIMAKEYRIDGMMCVHCKARVEKELATVAGVTSVVVDLDKKIAIIEGDHSESDIAAKVNAIGYEYIGVNK